MTISKRNLIKNIIILFFTVIGIILNLNGDINDIVAIFTILISACSVLKCKNNIYLFIIEGTILYCNYSICIPNYLSTADTSFIEFANEKVGAIGLNILFSYSVLNYILSPKVTRNIPSSIVKLGHYNPIIEWTLTILLMLIWFFGFTRPSEFGERGTPSALYEYSIIFIIFGFLFSGNRKIHKVLFFIISLLFITQNFVYGGRITGVQLLICCALCLCIEKINIKNISFCSFVIFPILIGIGKFRANFELSFDSIMNSMKLIIESKMTLDTAYSAYYTSLTFIKVEQFTDFSTKIYLLKQFVLSMFFGGSVPDSNLADYTREFFLHYWGGVIPFFGYFYLGVLGILIISLYLSWIKRLIIKDNNIFLSCLSIYVTTTTLRWYLYSPTQLFRGLLLLWGVYIVLINVDKIFRHKMIKFNVRSNSISTVYAKKEKI